MIETWSEENRPDYQKVLQEREAAIERGRKRRQLEEEALQLLVGVVCNQRPHIAFGHAALAAA